MGLLSVGLVLGFVQTTTVATLRPPLVGDWPVGTVDLPLTVAVAMAAAGGTRVVGPLFLLGLMVDLHTSRLFGLHALAFTAAGSVAGIAPRADVGARLSRSIAGCGPPAVVGATVVPVGVIAAGVGSLDGTTVLDIALRASVAVIGAAMLLRAGWSPPVGGRPASTVLVRGRSTGRFGSESWVGARSGVG